jgi:hypothetical protein
MIAGFPQEFIMPSDRDGAFSVSEQSEVPARVSARHGTRTQLLPIWRSMLMEIIAAVPTAWFILASVCGKFEPESQQGRFQA